MLRAVPVKDNSMDEVSPGPLTGEWPPKGLLMAAVHLSLGRYEHIATRMNSHNEGYPKSLDIANKIVVSLTEVTG